MLGNPVPKEFFIARIREANEDLSPYGQPTDWSDICQGQFLTASEAKEAIRRFWSGGAFIGHGELQNLFVMRVSDGAGRDESEDWAADMNGERAEATYALRDARNLARGSFAGGEVAA